MRRNGIATSPAMGLWSSVVGATYVNSGSCSYSGDKTGTFRRFLPVRNPQTGRQGMVTQALYDGSSTYVYVTVRLYPGLAFLDTQSDAPLFNNLCSGGTAIASSANGANVAANAFNANIAVGGGWMSADGSGYTNGTSRLGYDFGSAKAIRSMSLSQIYDTATGWGPVSSIKAQYSDNGSTWSDACTIPKLNTTGFNRFELPFEHYYFGDNGSHRYWSILGNSALVAGGWWGIFRLYFGG